jgi:hypothetical protein
MAIAEASEHEGGVDAEELPRARVVVAGPEVGEAGLGVGVLGEWTVLGMASQMTSEMAEITAMSIPIPAQAIRANGTKP